MDKVINEINNIYDGDVCSPPLRSWDKNGYEFQKFIFQSYLYYNNKYPYRKGDHKYPFEEEEEEEYIDPIEFWCQQQERIRDNPFPHTPHWRQIQKDRA